MRRIRVGVWVICALVIVCVRKRKKMDARVDENCYDFSLQYITIASYSNIVRCTHIYLYIYENKCTATQSYAYADIIYIRMCTANVRSMCYVCVCEAPSEERGDIFSEPKQRELRVQLRVPAIYIFNTANVYTGTRIRILRQDGSDAQ